MEKISDKNAINNAKLFMPSLSYRREGTVVSESDGR